MKSALLSLRRSPARILRAIEQQQEVTLTKRGRPVARIVPLQNNAKKKTVSSQPAFGMWRDLGESSVEAQVRKMRESRHHDL